MKQAENTDQDELRPEYDAADLVGGVRGKYAGRLPKHRITVSIECEQQPDGQWLARAPALPEAAGLADSREGAISLVETLAAAAIADQVMLGETPPAGLYFAITTIRTPPPHTPN
jgi:predicted RNase H-like HicB family nuclease